MVSVLFRLGGVWSCWRWIITFEERDAVIPVGVCGLLVMSVCVYFLSSVSSHRDPAQSSSSPLPARRYHHHHHHHYITLHHPLSLSLSLLSLYLAGYVLFLSHSSLFSLFLSFSKSQHEMTFVSIFTYTIWNEIVVSRGIVSISNWLDVKSSLYMTSHYMRCLDMSAEKQSCFRSRA